MPQGLEQENNNFTKRRLNRMYPDKSVKLLDNLDYKSLEGQLDLSEYLELEELKCNGNQLTSLEVSKNTKLRRLLCSSNKLTDLNITSLPTGLTYLDISYNNLVTKNLADFSHLVNLERLDLENTQIKGSLTALQNCSKLKYLDISNTNISEGLEYLPESLESFYYSSSCYFNFQVQKLAAEIKT